MKYRILLLLLFVAACAQTPEVTAPAPSAATADANPLSPTGTDLLTRYHWQLTNAIDSNGNHIDALFVRPDKPVQLDFSPYRITVVNSCNNMGAGYTVRKGRLQIGPMVSTMMACNDAALAALDDAISQRVRGSVTVNLLARDNAPSLQLVTDNGDTLSFTGVPTAETRYGGPGQIAFLEVGPQSVPCIHPLTPDAQCLLVRELFFDEQGLAIGTPGPWHPLNQNIEGYTHTPGIHNVVRVKRFSIKNPPADGPSVAYVLDLVVESQKVGQ